MKHPLSAHWFKASDISTRNFRPDVVSWLTDQGSLTKRIINHCPGQFSVRVLSQQWSRPDAGEAKLLQVPQRQRVLLRQVQLLCDDHVCVYARSIIPLKTLKGQHRRLRYLGNQPLGAYLFSNPSLRRKQQQIAHIRDKDPLFRIALSGSSHDCHQIWGRRSLFVIDHKPLLVNEYFLPSLFEK